MTESVADRMQLCKDRYNDIPQCLIDEARALEAENAELKAQLEDCTAVNAEVMKKVARLEKSINIQEIDSN